MRSKLADIPEKSFKEEYLMPLVKDPLKKYMPKPKVSSGIKVQDAEDDLLEAQVKDRCLLYLKQQGYIGVTIYTGGIPTASGRKVTNPAKGIPDCLVFKGSFTVWIEWKRGKGGKLSPEQIVFHKLLRDSGHTVWVVNSLKVLKEFIHGTIR